nr:MAG TPA: hypothetical protein [Caudoviricetes sp.]
MQYLLTYYCDANHLQSFQQQSHNAHFPCLHTVLSLAIQTPLSAIATSQLFFLKISLNHTLI